MFIDTLINKIAEKNSAICIGLDPIYEYIPDFLKEEYKNNAADVIREFNRRIVDATYRLTPVYKIQMAYYGRHGVYDIIKDTVDYIHSKNCLVILDGKRNDIGSTANAYADEVFGYFNGDAATVNAYFGTDGIVPFKRYESRGIFIIVKTSNKSGCEIQDTYVLTDIPPDTVADNKKVGYSLTGSGKYPNLRTGSSSGPTFIYADEMSRYLSKIPKEKVIAVKFYILMAYMVNYWSEQSDGEGGGNKPSNRYGYTGVGAVVGATYPAQLKELRKIMKRSFLLIPGYGAQGGTADSVKYGFDSEGMGAIVNASRSIIYAYRRKEFPGGEIRRFTPEEFAEAAEYAALRMKEDINSVRFGQ